MKIQWYPGHMTKAKRTMESDIKLVDLVIELVDARVPASSRNPDIDRLAQHKARLVLLNKSDLADESINRQWEAWFASQGILAVRLNAKSGTGMKAVQGAIQEACKEKMERDRRRGILNRPVRAMVVGIPNVGKSTFINSLARKAAAKTGNKPGVTKGNQWIRLNKNVELLDTPGILWPRFEDETIGVHLALIGSVNDEILNLEELAFEGIQILQKIYPGTLKERYGVEEGEAPYKILTSIAQVRNCIQKGGEADTDKAVRLFLDDLRSGRLGGISLERP
ncbi:ribosome biogenesis GTPase YlqF [Hominifimenecus sp. rT4P-3]|uniref:ribosome biogenesis GTPase YlqF n=1 Tax=Hominifimenecus sp. rT4P-3 TaxID=3242979 RepID=UPI003DA3DE5D